MSEQAEQQKKKPRKHKRKHRLLRLAIVAAVIAAAVLVAHLPYFDITQIAVIGNKTVTDEEIIELSGIKQENSIFLLNDFAIKHRIRKNLYIDEVSMDRQLPGTVEIIVKEREATAQFLQTGKNGRKKYILTDSSGMVLGKSDKQQDVTMIDDMTVTRSEKGSAIKVEETGSYRKAMDLISKARSGDVYFKRIRIKGSMVEAWIFDELLCKGRYDNLVSSMQTGALKSVVYTLYQDDVSKGIINIGDNNYCSFTPEN